MTSLLNLTEYFLYRKPMQLWSEMLCRMQQQATRLTAARKKKNSYFFGGFSCVFFNVDIDHTTSFLKPKKIIPLVFSNIMNPEVLTSCFHTSPEVTCTDTVKNGKMWNLQHSSIQILLGAAKYMERQCCKHRLRLILAYVWALQTRVSILASKSLLYSKLL